MIGRFFYLPKAKKFSYKPRYYDPDQEEREEREKRIKAEMGIVDESDPRAYYTSLIKGQFKKASRGKSKLTEEYKRKSNRRLLVLILILFLLFYLFFYR